MNPLPYLSVVIPVTGGRNQNLNLVLASLDAQTYRNFEVIVVNDGGNPVDEVLRGYKSLGIHYMYSPKHDPGLYGTPEQTMQPRNRGALVARYDFLVFADSDVVLSPGALGYYAEDFAANPDRIVIGSYDWLRPMRVSTVDVRMRFWDIIEERLEHMAIPPDAHSIMRDPRTDAFSKYPVEYVVQPQTAKEKYQMYPWYLNMYSGNIGWNKKRFWEIGGYWDALAIGAHEDGCSGIAACVAGVPLSLDYRIRGGHINHPFNVAYRMKLKEREIPMINARYHLYDAELGDFRDGTEELSDHLPSLETMSQNTLEWLGVAHWAKAEKQR